MTETLEKCVKDVQSCRSGVLIVSFKHISHHSLVLLVDFEQINVSWGLNFNRDAFLAAKIRKKRLFNVWIKSHFSNSDVG